MKRIFQDCKDACAVGFKVDRRHLGNSGQYPQRFAEKSSVMTTAWKKIFIFSSNCGIPS